jgi:hypothetical protein
MGLRDGAYFDQETFGVDKLIVGLGGEDAHGGIPLDEVLSDAPLTELARKKIPAQPQKSITWTASLPRRTALIAHELRRFPARRGARRAGTLKEGGFDPARDITAITVNRWPHG